MLRIAWGAASLWLVAGAALAQDRSDAGPDAGPASSPDAAVPSDAGDGATVGEATSDPVSIETTPAVNGTPQPIGPERHQATTADALPENPDARARALYERADRAYSEGRLEDAIDDFRAAYELSGRALLLFNIANAFERLGSYRSAVNALHRYREVAPAAERDTLDRRIESLEQRIAVIDRERHPPEPPPVEPNLLPSAVMLAVAGSSVLAGIGFGIAATIARADAEEHCFAVGADTICDQRAQSALTRDTAFSATADVLLGVGLVSAGGALIWWFLETDRARGAEAPVDVEVTASAHHAQIEVGINY